MEKKRLTKSGDSTQSDPFYDTSPQSIRKCCFKGIFGLISPILILLVIIMILLSSRRLLNLIEIVMMLIFYAIYQNSSPYSFSTSVIDIFLISIIRCLVSIFIATVFPWRSHMQRLLHLLLTIIIWIYAILKLNAFKKEGSVDSIAFFLLIAPALGATFSLISECWLWTSKEQLKSAENAVILAHTDVTVGQRIINSISCVEGISYYEYSTGLSKSEHRPPLVIFHGYGTGKGVFAQSVAALSEHFHVYVLDTYGTGLSGGVAFVPNPNRNCSSCRRSISTVDDAELFYIEAVERWRHALNIEKFYLCGHSFGGYIASAYALHYPDNILHLCLLSPVGFPKAAQLTQWNCLLYIIRFVWNQGYTVQHFFQLLGPFSSYIIRKAVAMRFSMRDNRAHSGGWFNVSAFANYIFHSNVSPVSGNNGFPKLIGPGAYARRPMGERVAKLIKCPTTFAYGEFDWMDKKSGESVGRALKKRDIYSDVQIISGVGHHVYLNKEAFTKTIIQLIQV